MCILVIKPFRVSGRESQIKVKKNSTEYGQILRPTGYIYSQIGEDKTQIIYLNGESTTESVGLGETSEKSTELLRTLVTPVTDRPKQTNLEKFVKLAAKFFDKKNTHKSVIDSPTKATPSLKKHHQHTYETYEEQSLEDLQQQPNYFVPTRPYGRPPYGLVIQTPPTKGMLANYKSSKNSPLLFGNPFRFYRPIHRKILILPLPKKPPPVTKPPARKHGTKHDHPKKHEPPEKHEPPKENKPSKKHEPPKHSPSPKKHHKKLEPEQSNEEKSSEHKSESDNDADEENDEEEEEGEGGSDEDIEESDNDNNSEHESHERKVHKKHEEKHDSVEKKEQHGHNSNKKDDKRGHDDHESGFVKETGVKYNEEGRKRKGFETDKGYKKFDSFGNGRRKEFDEKHHLENLNKKKAHDAASYDASDGYRKQHESLRGDNGGKLNEHKLHKKGSKTTGFHNIFHKDEYKKVHTFYDDADHRGKFKKFGNEHQNHGYNKASTEDHRHHESGHSDGNHSENGKFKKGYDDLENHNYSKRHGHDNEHSNEQVHSNNGYRKKTHKALW